MTETSLVIDCYLAGFLGGVTAFLVTAIMYFGYLKHMLKKQARTISAFKKTVNMLALSKEVEILKAKILSLHKTLGV